MPRSWLESLHSKPLTPARLLHSQLAAFQLGRTVGPSLPCTIPTTLWAKPHSTHNTLLADSLQSNVNYWSEEPLLLINCLLVWLVCIKRLYRNTHKQSQPGCKLLSESRGYHSLALLKVWVPGNCPSGSREEVKSDQMIIIFTFISSDRENIFDALVM